MIWHQRRGEARSGGRPLPLLAAVGELGASAQVAGGARWTAPAIAERARLAGIVSAGALGAALVGYVTAQSPAAAPAHVAVELRVAIVMSLVVAGAFALASPGQQRTGRLLVAGGLFSCVWLVNGSSNEIAFSVGVAAAALAVPFLYYILLAHPAGRLHSRHERLLFAAFSAALVAAWEFCWLTSPQPPTATPLLRCASRCPSNAFYVGSSSATHAVASLFSVIWVTIAVGTFLLLLRRLRLASPPLRRSIMPTAVVAMFSMLCLVGFLISPTPKSETAEVFGYLYVGTSIAIPLAVLLGIALERQFMGRALAQFVDQLAGAAPSRVQGLMADVLHDPTLTISHRPPLRGSYVDAANTAIAVSAAGSRRAITEIERDGHAVTSVMYDRELADQEPFVRAAGAAAALRLQELQLEADLKASMADLARSRRRLVDAADAERQRIERDLHDGAQQHLVGMRVKLELAIDAIVHDRARGERMLAEIGEELDAALAELRSLAQGVYPPLLAEHGLAEALKSAARACSVPVATDVRRSGRYPPEIETAIYFCCREALQNVAKHAGAGAAARLRLWEDGSLLRFEVSDSGVGFGAAAAAGNGVENMHDRVEAVGGSLELRSRAGSGTIVRGSVPLASASPVASTAAAGAWPPSE
jgi:signal transduction histidine kinase